MKRTLTIAGILFFGMCAYWQFNDPDAFWWVLIYAVTSLAGIAVLFKRLPWQIPAILTLATLGLSFYYVQAVIAQELHYFNDEVGREMMGTILVCLYMSLLAMHARTQ